MALILVASSSITVRVKGAGTPRTWVRVETGTAALDLTQSEWADLCLIVRAVEASGGGDPCHT